MSQRTDRLYKVLVLQKQLKKLHETRQAMHVANARAAEAEVEDIVNAFNAEGSLSSLFPDLYHARVASAAKARQEHLANVHVEAARVAKASARADAVRREFDIARRADDRAAEERDQIESVSRLSCRK